MSVETRTDYLSDYLAAIPESHQAQDRDVELLTIPAVRLHLCDPSMPATELAAASGGSVEDVRKLYAVLCGSEAVRLVTLSPFYPRKLMTQFAADTVADWNSDPEYAGKIVGGEAVSPRTLEVHATRGTCDYTCTMCLWSDKEELTYRGLGLAEAGLMTADDWTEVFRSSQELGAQRIVFSGGGEPLLNKDFYGLAAAARELGLKTQLYSNGFGLRKAGESEWNEVLGMEQVRFSMHSPTDDVYNAIVAMPPHSNALPVVSANIRELISRRNDADSRVRVGIGFVTQALNHTQIEQMVDFAKELGVDFINLRQDEVEVTRSLKDAERAEIARQLVSIRQRMIGGDFGSMHVDMSDDMTAMANGTEQFIRRVGSCMVKAFRPAISPFGVFAPCDLRAEPRFSDPDYVFGNVKRQSLPLIMDRAAKADVDPGCDQCMPSGRTINAVVAKLLNDYKGGIDFREQPFAHSS